MQGRKHTLWCLGLVAVVGACTQGQGEKVSLPEKNIAQKPAAAAAPPLGEAGATASSASSAPAVGSAVNPTQPPEVPPLPMTSGATPSDNPQQTRLTGQVSSQKRTALAFRIAGVVQEIRLKPGDPCKKGDILATLDPRDTKLAVDLARAQRDLARVAYTNARSDFEREEQLKRENVSTEVAFEKQKAVFENARINLQIADINLTRAQQALDDTKLVAPYSCVISKQMKFLGEHVPAGTAVFEIYDTSDIELDFSVPERLAGKLKVGDSIQVQIPATGFQGAVAIVRLVPVVEQSTRTFRIVVKAPQDERVVPGLYAEAVLR